VDKIEWLDWSSTSLSLPVYLPPLLIASCGSVFSITYKSILRVSAPALPVGATAYVRNPYMHIFCQNEMLLMFDIARVESKTHVASGISLKAETECYCRLLLLCKPFRFFLFLLNNKLYIHLNTPNLGLE